MRLLCIFMYVSYVHMYVVYIRVSCNAMYAPCRAYCHPGELPHVIQEILDTGKALFTTGANLVRRQDEAIVTGITELNGVAVVGLDDVGGPVDAGARGRVDGGADGTVLEAGAVDGLDGIDSSAGEGDVFVVSGGQATAGPGVGYVTLASHVASSQ